MGMHNHRNLRRAATVAAAAAATVVAAATPASAHVPVMLGPGDRTPARGPLITDGANPYAFFAQARHAGEKRAGQFVMAAGEPVNIFLAIPDEAPENTLPTDELPTMVLTAPDGTSTTIAPTFRVPIVSTDVASQNLNIMFLGHFAGPAEAGTYSFVLVSHAAERFGFTIGIEGPKVYGIERGRAATDRQVLAWYSETSECGHGGGGHPGRRLKDAD